MATAAEINAQITETRQNFIKRAQEIEAAKKALRPTSGKRRAFTPRSERVAMSQYGRQIGEAEQSLATQQQEFERSVVLASPTLALPQYVEDAYQKTISEIQAKINKYNEKIQKYKDKLRKKNLSKKTEQRYEDYIDAYQDKVRAYERGLRGSKGDVIQKWESGYTEELSDYEYDKSLAKAPQKAQEAEIKKLLKQGYTPTLIESFDKGKPQSASLTFYNKELNKYTSMPNIPLAKGKDISNLPKYKDELTTITSPLNIGGQTFNFTTHEYLYEQPKGGLTTPFFDLGVTKTQFEAQQELDRKKYYEENLPSPITTPVPQPEQNWAQSITNDLFGEGWIGKTATAIGTGVGWVKEKVKSSELVGIPIIPGVFSLSYGDLTKIKQSLPQKTQNWIDNQFNMPVSTVSMKIPQEQSDGTIVYVPYREVYPDKLTIPMSEAKKVLSQPFTDIKTTQLNAIKTELDKKYQDEVTARVYGAYKTDLEKGIITFEQAWKNYLETNDYKLLSQNYTKDFNVKLKETSTPMTKFADIGLAGFDVVPDTWGEFSLGAGLLAAAPAKVAVPIVFSKPIAATSSALYMSLPSPETGVGKFAKGSLFSAGIELFAPAVGIAYGAEIVKGLAVTPEETTKSFLTYSTENPEEMAGFLVGGRVLSSAARHLYAKVSPRAVEVKIVKTAYGEIPVQNIPKYGRVAWIKGALSASEKIAIAKQIFKITGQKVRIFVQVSPQGVPMQTFAMRKGAGFEIRQVSQPLRGWYENPPMELLRQYYAQVQTEAGGLSYYAGKGRREGILPDLRGVWDVLTGKAKFSRQRPFEYLRRTGTEVKLPKWIADATNAILNKKTIPKATMKIINKWYNKFMETKLEFNGKTYTGVAKLKLLQDYNLRGGGSGIKLKYYAAMMQYQLTTRIQLPSGAENLAGIMPYGPEHQLVSSIGTRFYEKPLSDLRTSKQLGWMESLTGKSTFEWVFGTKTGEAFALIDNRIIEIQPVRAFPGKIPKTTTPADVMLTGMTGSNTLNLFSDVKGAVGGYTGVTGSGSGSQPALPGVRYPRPIYFEIIPEIPEFSLTTIQMQPPKRETAARTGYIEPLIVYPEPPRPERTEPVVPRTYDYPELTEFTYRPRPEPPRRPETPIRREDPVSNWLWMPEEEKKKKKKKGKKKKIMREPGYMPAPTGFEVAFGTPIRQPRKTRYTGFEPLRFF